MWPVTTDIPYCILDNLIWVRVPNKPQTIPIKPEYLRKRHPKDVFDFYYEGNNDSGESTLRTEQKWPLHYVFECNLKVNNKLLVGVGTEDKIQFTITYKDILKSLRTLETVRIALRTAFCDIDYCSYVKVFIYDPKTNIIVHKQEHEVDLDDSVYFYVSGDIKYTFVRPILCELIHYISTKDDAFYIEFNALSHDIEYVVVPVPIPKLLP